MIFRFKCWRVRRNARYASHLTNFIVYAKMGDVVVGKYRKGRELPR